MIKKIKKKLLLSLTQVECYTLLGDVLNLKKNNLPRRTLQINVQKQTLAAGLFLLPLNCILLLPWCKNETPDEEIHFGCRTDEVLMFLKRDYPHRDDTE